MEKQKRLTVEEAAKILDCSKSAIRKGMVQGSLPIGWVNKEGLGKYSYYILESKVDLFAHTINYTQNSINVEEIS